MCMELRLRATLSARRQSRAATMGRHSGRTGRLRRRRPAIAKDGNIVGKSSGRRARSVVLVLIVILLASACGTTQPSPPPTTSAAPSNPQASPSASADIPTGNWAKVDLPPLNPTASLEATKRGEAGVATDTAFKIRSLDGTPADELAQHLTSQPALAFQADPAVGVEVLVRPTTALVAGTAYRFRLAREDGTLAGSWAITAAKPLHVVGTLPRNEAMRVPTDTGIEITFDQAGVTADDFESHFAISPAVAGRFEVHGRVVAFVPSAKLKRATVYTVTVRHGLPLPGTGQTLEDDVVARFETTRSSKPNDLLVFPVKLFDAGTRDEPIIGVTFFDLNSHGVKAPKTLPVKVYRLDSLATAIADYARLVKAPDWARSGGAPIDTSALPLVDERDGRDTRVPRRRPRRLDRAARPPRRRLVRRLGHPRQRTPPGHAPGHRRRDVRARDRDANRGLDERRPDWRGSRRRGGHARDDRIWVGRTATACASRGPRRPRWSASVTRTQPS